MQHFRTVSHLLTDFHHFIDVFFYIDVSVLNIVKSVNKFLYFLTFITLERTSSPQDNNNNNNNKKHSDLCLL